MSDDEFRRMMASHMPKKPATAKSAANISVIGKGTAPDTSLKRPSSDFKLPISERAQLEQHSKTVSCVEFDRSGGRLVTGSYDYNIAYYDFGGMDKRMLPFRCVNPDGAYKMKALRFSADGKWLLAATSSNTAVLMDREGSRVRTYAEGDQYLRDLKNTNGHVAALSTCYWNPGNADQFLTSSADGTVRIWNIGYRQRQDYVIIVRSRKAAAGRSPVTHARFNSDASMIITGSEDGSLKLFPGKGPWTFPAAEVTAAHEAGSEITCLAMDQATGHLIASRAVDGTVKLWDTRNWTKPLATASGLTNYCSETACVFSPDDGLIVTGTSAKRDHEWGRLVFLDARSDLQVVHEESQFTKSSVVGLAWSPVLNQIVTGNGDGTASILWDPEVSQKGALLAMAKGQTAPLPSYVTDAVVGRIMTPYAPQEGQSLKRQRIKDRKDPVASHLPTPPSEGPGQGGRLGSGFSHSIMADRISTSTRDEDPREALLKYAKKAEEDPMFVSPAYQATQPKPVLDSALLEKEAREEARKLEEKARAAKLRPEP